MVEKPQQDTCTCKHAMTTTRYGHTSSVIQNEVYIFGGVIIEDDSTKVGGARDQLLSSSSFVNNLSNDLLRFDCRSGQLLLVEPNDVAISSSVVPPPRNFHSAVVYNDCLYVFGGKSNGYFSDVYCYSPALNTWTSLCGGTGGGGQSTTGVAPSRRYGHTAAVIGDEMFIFGGYDSNGDSCNDLFAFHLVSHQWREVKLKSLLEEKPQIEEDESSGDEPSEQLNWTDDLRIRGRFHHVMTAWNNRYLIIHGGIDGHHEIMDDLIVIDTETQLWHTMEIDGDSSSVAPYFARYGHTGVVIPVDVNSDDTGVNGIQSNELLVLGGYASDRNLFKESFKMQFNQDCTRVALIECSDYDMTRSNELSPALPCAPLYCTANAVFTPDTNEMAVILFGGTTKVALSTTKVQEVIEDDSVVCTSVSNSNRSTENDAWRNGEFIELVHQFPSDAALFILSFLTVKDWCNIRLVSKNWKFFEVTSDNLLWRTVFDSAVQHVRYDPVRIKVLNKVNRTNNYRQKLIVLRKTYTKYLSAIEKKRLASIREQPSFLPKKHVYYGMDGLKNMFSKIQTPLDAENIFGSYSMTYGANETKLDLRNQGNLKVVVVGDGAVGKTCLLIRAVTGVWPQDYVPTVFDNYTLTGDYWGPRNIQLWDTAGPEEYDRLRPLSYPFTTVFLLCFSIVSESSFCNVSAKWLPELTHHCPDAAILLVGTKADLRDSPDMLRNLRSKNCEPVSSEGGEQLAKHHRCIAYLETSSLTGHNVDRLLFDTIVQASLIGLSANTRHGSRKEKKCIVC